MKWRGGGGGGGLFENTEFCMNLSVHVFFVCVNVMTSLLSGLV